METIRKIKQLRSSLNSIKAKGKTVGFVPTMGCLHQGHLSLIERAREDNDFVVVSVFVNPAQFGPEEDYRKYPRNFKQDQKIAGREGVDVIFFPSAQEMYSKDHSVYVDVDGINNILCGVSRAGHFRGVATIVTKLLNIIRPDISYFGQKDFQQALLIKKVVKDLNLPIKIKVLPTVREKDGLAMSSRNSYLNAREREDALILYESLKQAKRMIASGTANTAVIKSKIKKLISAKKSAGIDYIAIVDSKTLIEIEKVKKNMAVLLAVWIGKTRLIDNLVVN